MTPHAFVLRLDRDGSGVWRGTFEALASGRSVRFEGLNELVELIEGELIEGELRWRRWGGEAGSLPQGPSD